MTAHDHEQGAGPVAGPRPAADGRAARESPLLPGLDPARTALVTIDLMDRILALPLAPLPGPAVLAAALDLAAVFRKAGAPVVAVRAQRPGAAEQPAGSDLAEGVVQDGDLVVVKHTVGAFQDTGLHERLRELGVDTLVMAGVATNLGVESTARAAADLGYRLVFAEDAMSGLTAAEHRAAVSLDFPRFGTVVTAAEVEFASG
ncbi:isochorismatase family protein [Actinacidiphila bryophytorum]|uniref:Nicotinamidase/isochorismatase family protein n=1 Tax=Actinacidiphila bryophytorum TaxID=1436133 RepID=A0A9W4GYT2_9ACTN|nr:isochorismatase family protein [Actinacidiphila bryophytorum]MBM9439262.1 isochorismatase family protein [Actinacidiphila bryophytorum]MBN6543050.1 isochorismatase family protein [Actinacidiphila bryophytorum]CAG7619778.1 Nicotinamidase/isochorismatase family protein [Actinacidiphila bryophytorum]